MPTEADRNHYDVRTGMRVTCLPSKGKPLTARCTDGYVATAMSAEVLTAAMRDHGLWLKSPNRT
jgi:hypothetical protein